LAFGILYLKIIKIFRNCKVRSKKYDTDGQNLLDISKSIGTRFVEPPPPFFFKFVNSSLLWDVFIINSVEQLQTLPKTQSEIDISPFLKTQKPSSSLFIMKTSGHKSDELKNKKKGGGPQIGYL
jgi:hypothetical protein